MDDLTNADGVVIAWLSDSGCENKACLKAIKEGRTIHMTPTHLDPRAENVHLALPTYHFVTREEAAEVLEIAWSIAPEVATASDRDLLYSKNVPVKVSKSIDLEK